jgi:biopolymer transport protein ExbB/TolQ
MEHAASALSPIGLFLQTGPVGKTVLLVLLLASIWCWVLIVETVWSVVRLRQAVAHARAGTKHPSIELLGSIMEAGSRAASMTIPGESVGEARTRVAEAMSRAAQVLLMRIEGGLPNLAIISSVAPFIGLFGTVWGIMVSFAAIAEAKDTSLAVVAPGIAEALAATAIGLAAAIPATIGYNRIGAALARNGQNLQHLIEEDAIRIAAHAEAIGREQPEGDSAT